MKRRSWPAPRSPRAKERVSHWRPWAYGLLVLALAGHVAPGCRRAAHPPDLSPGALNVTPTAEPPHSTPSILSMAAPSPTWTPSPTKRDSGETGDQAYATDTSATLRSLRRVDDYPLYTMRYYGAYGRDGSHMETPAWATDVTRSSNWACSLFAALGDAEQRLYGRNFDWLYSPALLLFTDPPGGYASVSMVDIAYFVDPNDVPVLMDIPLEDREPLLEAPLWPFDGMNEHGLAVGMAAVPQQEMPYDPKRETIDSLGLIREMLDHARDVEEAVAILGRYNIAWDGGPPLHYLIADAAGRAVLVEFYEGDMVLIRSPAKSAWHVATNHLRAPLDDGSTSGYWRYDSIRDRLETADGSLTLNGAVYLLADVAQENTQWSVVYDLSGRVVHVAMGRAYEGMHTFQLSP